MGNPAGKKQAIRSEALARRDAIDIEARAVLDDKTAGRLLGLKEYTQARRVLLYASFRSEVSARAIKEHALANGKELVLPKVDEPNACLTKHVIGGLHELSEGYMGIPEPTTDECVKVEDMDIVIVPGVAFSPAGARIGYGGGYYDKLLLRAKGRIPIIALAYEEQVYDTLPSEAHDVRMDMIVTPERLITCNG